MRNAFALIKYLGDYHVHKGNPSFLRSDSMLKAIGESINIRVSGLAGTKIPIFILGNTPINESYKSKVDFLKTSGVVQGFLSLNPNPTKSKFIKKTPKNGFLTISSYLELKIILSEILKLKINYFSSMLSEKRLGEIISLSNKGSTDEEKAEIFLTLIRK